MAQSPTRLKLTRDQLASFLKDFEQIKQFEALFGTVDEISQTTVLELINQAAQGVAQANKALALVSALAKLVQPLVVATKAMPQLKALPDVRTDQPQARQTLVYDGTTGRWLNDFLELADLGDVTVTAPADGQLLIYDSGAGVFENATLTPGTNITITNGPGSITINAAGVSGASGSFTTVDGKTVTVTNGIVTSIV